MIKKFCVIFATICLLSGVPYGCKQPVKDKVDSIEIFAEYFDNGLISADMTVKYNKKFVGQNDALFNLYPLAYTDKVSVSMLTESGISGDFNLIRVKADGKSASYSYIGNDNCVLAIDLSDIFKKADTAEINIKFSVTLPIDNNRLGVAEKTVNSGNFFPMPAPYLNGEFITFRPCVYGDPFVSDVSSYKVRLQVPATYTVAASLPAKSCDVSDNRTLYTYKGNNLRDFCFVMSKEYNVAVEKWGNRSVNYYFYNDLQSEITIGFIKQCLEFYEETFGKYPYDAFSAAQTMLKYGGMEYPCLIMVSSDLPYKNYLYVLAHEIAHQWWYAVVGNNQFTEYFIDEGLAEYSAYLFFEKHTEYGIIGDAVYEKAKTELSAYKKLADKSGFTQDYEKHLPLWEMSSELQYQCFAYSRPFTILYETEKSIGRAALALKLSVLYNSNVFKTVYFSEISGGR